VVKAKHNLWHTGTRHQQYFGEEKACCMCNCETEDWRHVLVCGSIDASIHRAVSWGKLRKSIDRCHLPQNVLTTIEKGVNDYTEQPHNITTQSKENEPQNPFRVTCNTPRNLLQKAFRTQSHIGWDNFLKGQISRDWLTYVQHNEENSNGHGKIQDWSAKFIAGLWEHLKRLWKFRNDIDHQVLIPQLRLAHKYPISPWEMIHPPEGDNPVRI
jgi:hypothetical protein